MGSWKERISEQQRKEEEIDLQSQLKHKAHLVSAREALQLREGEIHKIISSVVDELDLVELLTSLNNEVWGGLGKIEITEGKYEKIKREYKRDIPERFWNRVSLIFQYQEHSPITETITKRRFGPYTESLIEEVKVGFGESESRPYEKSRFGFYEAYVGTKTTGVNSKQAEESLDVTVSSDGTSNLFDVNFSGGDHLAHYWLGRQFPYDIAEKGVSISGGDFSYQKGHPLAKESANQVIVALLAKGSQISKELGLLPQQLSKKEAENLERITSEIGKIK